MGFDNPAGNSQTQANTFFVSGWLGREAGKTLK
jgi:hypothetical protein